MPRFLVANHSDSELLLGIEPWADSETLLAGERAFFEYWETDDVPTSLEFAVEKENQATVFLGAARVRVLAKGGDRSYETPKGIAIPWKQAPFVDW